MTLYYLFLFFLPFQEHPILGAKLLKIGSFPVTPIKVLGVLMVAAAMTLPRPKDAVPRPAGGLIVLFAAFAVFPLAGTVLSLHYFPGADASCFISFGFLLVATSALIVTPDRMRNAVRTMVLAETFGSTWLYKQYYIYHWWRPLGPSADPNYEALALVLTLPLAVWMARYEETRPWRRIGLVCVPTLAFAVFVTQSRGGLAALVITCGLVWLNSKHRFRLAVQLSAAAGILLVLGPANLIRRLEQIRFFGSVESGAELSTRSRWELGRAAVHMIEAHPVFGIGLDRFKEAEVRYNPHLLIVDPVRHIAHNTYLQLGAEGGLPTLALYLAILSMTILTCKAIERNPQVPEPLTALAYSLRIGLIGFMFAAVFLSAQFVKEPWVLICLAPNLYEIARRAAKGAKTARRRPDRARRAVLTPQFRPG